MSKSRQFRQGDVFIESTRAPKDTEIVKPDGDRVILAAGEMTGHHHAVPAAEAAMLARGAERFLRVTTPTALRHEEHAQIALSRGTYKVIIQREEWDDEIRSVVD